jgi:hypothetical protein
MNECISIPIYYTEEITAKFSLMIPYRSSSFNMNYMLCCDTIYDENLNGFVERETYNLNTVTEWPPPLSQVELATAKDGNTEATPTQHGS